MIRIVFEKIWKGVLNKNGFTKPNRKSKEFSTRQVRFSRSSSGSNRGCRPALRPVCARLGRGSIPSWKPKCGLPELRGPETVHLHDRRWCQRFPGTKLVGQVDRTTYLGDAPVTPWSRPEKLWTRSLEKSFKATVNAYVDAYSLTEHEEDDQRILRNGCMVLEMFMSDQVPRVLMLIEADQDVDADSGTDANAEPNADANRELNTDVDQKIDAGQKVHHLMIC
ncbi:hypothetical protein LINPERPRIM_LOCUS24902 [Linum perenne]